MTQVILLIIGATLFYSLQGTLYTKYARKYDGLRVAQIRNISMIITGLPLLFLSQDISRITIKEFLPRILISGILGAIHVFISYKSYTYIPAGIAQVIKKSMKSIVVLFISLFILHEVFTVSQGRGLALVTFGALWLGSHKIDIRHLDLQNIKLGLILVVLAGAMSAIGRYVFSIYNKAFDAYLATYLLEMIIGVVYIVWMIGETLFSNQPIAGFRGLQMMSGRDIMSMTAITFLVLGGTLCSSLALTLGGYGFTGLLSIIGVPMSFMLARIILKEKITRTQAMAVGVILVGLWIL